jgi:3-isopropylmalate/(R)-2-methylmalate dehydratase large subunit
MSIECGARGGLIAPDQVTFDYIKGREFAPKGAEWDKKLAYWKTLYSDKDAVFDTELTFDAADIEPMITYGTNPGMGMGITQTVPSQDDITFKKALDYMKVEAGKTVLGTPG